MAKYYVTSEYFKIEIECDNYREAAVQAIFKRMTDTMKIPRGDREGMRLKTKIHVSKQGFDSYGPLTVTFSITDVLIDVFDKADELWEFHNIYEDY